MIIGRVWVFLFKRPGHPVIGPSFRLNERLCMQEFVKDFEIVFLCERKRVREKEIERERDGES